MKDDIYTVLYIQVLLLLGRGEGPCTLYTNNMLDRKWGQGIKK